MARYMKFIAPFLGVRSTPRRLALREQWQGLGTTAVSTLCWRYDATELALNWSASNNMWLNRAAIQHQRGWKKETDVDFVLSICEARSANKEFFIAQATGWALRDISRFNALAVQRFLRHHPNLSNVAVREARRGLGI